MSMLQDTANMLLQNAIAVIPIAIIVAVLCKSIRMRPATRHTLWLGVLVFLIIPPSLPEFSKSLLRTASDAVEMTQIDNDPKPALETTVQLQQPVFPAPLKQPNAGTTTSIPAWTPSRAPVERSTTVERTAPVVRDFAREPAQHQVFREIWHANEPEKASAGQALAVIEREQSAPVPSTSNSNETALIPSAIESARVFSRSALLIAGESLERAQAKASAGIDSVRSVVGAIPRIPASIWFGGVALVLTIGLLRLFIASRLIRHATPAPASVQTLIDSAAQQMGLRRAPRTLMVGDHVSPMVWCGRRLTLILPRTLWSELDESGRRAVVQHELAHIRRRDHWVRWAEMLVGTLYWWHPVVWWARRRVREEADLSCDLWVTALMPGVRASYARALLRTKQYVSDGDRGVPLVGIGAVSPGAKCFTRRITMVMTTRMSPRNSIVGVALAASLVMGGVYSAPGWACDSPKSHNHQAQSAPSAPEPPHHDEDLSTFEQYMIERAPEAPEAPEPSACESTKQSQAKAPACASGQRSERVVTSLGSINGKVHSMITNQYANAPLALVGDHSETKVKYTIKGDRLERLVRLMAREDVPILVEPVEDGIIVHGNADVQRRFGAFFALLAPKETIVEYNVSNKGKLKDLTSLMVLNSVPTRISPNDKTMRIHGDANTQRAFTEFLAMIDPGSSMQLTRSSGGADPYAVINQSRHPLEHEAAKVEQRVLGMFEEAQRLREMEAALLKQAEQIEIQAEKVELESDTHRDQADAILEEIEALLDRVESMSEEEQYKAMMEAEHSQREASRLMHFAEAIETQVDHVMTQAESLAHEASRFGLQADALEEQAEALAESLEEQLEDLEEILEDRVDEFHEWTTEHADALRELLEEHAERLDEELTRRLEHIH